MDAEGHGKKTYVLGIAELWYPVSPQEGMKTTRWICHTPLACTPRENKLRECHPRGASSLETGGVYQHGGVGGGGRETPGGNGDHIQARCWASTCRDGPERRRWPLEVRRVKETGLRKGWKEVVRTERTPVMCQRVSTSPSPIPPHCSARRPSSEAPHLHPSHPCCQS